MSNTFGFEAEFENNVLAVMGALHALDLTGSNDLHGYHCTCEDCSFDSPYVFRGQADSSCGGEVISTVFDTGDWDEALHAMQHLQDAAIEADAEPSMRAGFHVHVGCGHMSNRDRAKALWAYLRWEDVLGDVAARGRFPEVRPFNYRLNSGLYPYFGHLDEHGYAPFEYRSRGFSDDTLSVDEMTAHCTDDQMLRLVQKAMLDAALEADRHSWLNLATRGHRTFEYRLWNATRSAWRMEMFARLSLVMVEPDMVEALIDADSVNEAKFLTLAAQHDSNLGALLERQLASPATIQPFTLLAA